MPNYAVEGGGDPARPAGPMLRECGMPVGLERPLRTMMKEATTGEPHLHAIYPHLPGARDAAAEDVDPQGDLDPG